MRKIKAILAGAVLVLSGLAVADQPATAGAPVYAAPATLAPPARLPWGDLAQQTGGAPRAVTPNAAPREMPGRAGATSRSSKLTGSTYFYNTADQTPPASTTAVWANGTVAAPALSGGNHSLGEIAVIQTNAGKRQIVEIGWTVDANGVNGTDHTNPHLFGYWWKNEVPQGWNPGSPAFIPAAGAVTALGASLSSAVGTSKRFGIEYTGPSGSSPGCWWLAYDTAYVGCFPDTDWSGTTLGGAGATPGVTFNSVPYYQMFGEINYPGAAVPASSVCTDMGNGILGSTTVAPLSASFGSAQVNTGGVLVNANMSTGAQANPTYWNTWTPSGRTIRYGGPGAC